MITVKNYPANRIQEQGSVDSLLFIVPTIFFVIVLISVLDIGLTLNRLNSSAIYIGRQIAREPEISHSISLTQSIIENHKVDVVDFHIMHVPIGNRVFVQLVLVGKPFMIGRHSFTPSGRSLTLQDLW